MFINFKAPAVVNVVAAIFSLSLPASLAQVVPASSPAPGLTVVKVPLLVPPQPGARVAAAIANVEVRKVRGVGGAVFTQRVPPEASRLLTAVSAHLEKIHPGKLKTGRIEITYTGSVSATDLEASGLALAIALDAAVGEWVPDPQFMAVGGFDADGEMQPVEDAIPRLLAVMKSGARRVLMTEKQVAQVTDMMIGSGAPVFAGTLFYSVNSYEDVRPIADSILTAEMRKGLTAISEVQRKLFAKDANTEEVLRDDGVKEALRETLTATPSCVSARLLLRVNTGQFEKLSREGTFYAIENLAPTVFTAVRSAAPNDLTKISNAVVQGEIARLDRARPHFSDRSLTLLQAVINYGEAVRTFTVNPAADAAEAGARNRTLVGTAREVLLEITKIKAPTPPKR